MTGTIGLLRAVSEQAKKHTDNGGPDIQLASELTHIGRNVPKQPGLPLPLRWAQVSGKHCQVMGNTKQGYKVLDTSTNGTFIIAEGHAAARVPKNEVVSVNAGDTLRLSTLPSNNAGNALEWRLEFVTDDRRVRKTTDAGGADGALPAKRLCLSNGVDTPSKPQEEANSRLVDQLMQTNRELKSKLEQERKQTEELRRDLDIRAAELQQLTTEAAAARQQAVEDAAAAAREAAIRFEVEIKELLDARKDLIAQLEQQRQAGKDAQDAKAALAADLEARQAEVEELRQQVSDLEQQRDKAADALSVAKKELQTKLDSEGAEAVQLREQLQQSVRDAQELGKQAETAGEAQRAAQQEAEALRRERDILQREKRTSDTEKEVLLEDMALLRDEVAVGKRQLAKQLDLWAQQRSLLQRVAASQQEYFQAYFQAQEALQDPKRRLEHDISKLDSFSTQAAAGAKQAQPARTTSGAAPGAGTQHTTEASSLQQLAPAPSTNGGGAAGWTGTQPATSSPAPANAATAAEGEPSAGHIAAAAPSASAGEAGAGDAGDAGNSLRDVMQQDTQHAMPQDLQQDSAPDAGTQLGDVAAPPAAGEAATAGASAPSFEPGQAADTLGLGPGRATGASAGNDTPDDGSESPAAGDEAAAGDKAASGGSGGAAHDGQGGSRSSLASQEEEIDNEAEEEDEAEEEGEEGAEDKDEDEDGDNEDMDEG